MAERVMTFLRSAAAAVTGTPARTPADEVARRDQLKLVEILTDDSKPNEAMQQLLNEYRSDVAEGLITSSR